MITLISLLATASPLPAELAEALDSPEDPTLPVYEAVYHAEDIEVVATVDPSRSEGQRINVLSPDREDWPEDFDEALAGFDAESDGDIWCDTMNDMIGGDVQEQARAEGAITYHFRLAVDDPEDKADKAFAKAAHGEIDIARADGSNWKVSSIRIILDKPFKPAFIAKITEMDIDISCAAAPNGRMYQAATSTRVKGSAFGKRFEESETILLRDVSFPSQ
ncbi:MAG: hypothetical protein AAGA69_08415 [Pseudomonadota bacterium]